MEEEAEFIIISSSGVLNQCTGLVSVQIQTLLNNLGIGQKAPNHICHSLHIIITYYLSNYESCVCFLFPFLLVKM